MSQQDCLGNSSIHGLNKTNSATIVNERYKGKFVSLKISLLSKGLKFVSTPRGINKALIKEELEAYGRKLRLMWQFRNDEREFSYDPFNKNSKFYPKRKDAAIELYLSRLE